MKHKNNHSHNHHTKHIYGTPDTKKRAIHRIQIIQGHLKKVQSMLESNEYCVNIVHQSKAVQEALKKLDMLLIEDHLKTCVVDQMQNGEEEKTTSELLKLFDYK